MQQEMLTALQGRFKALRRLYLVYLAAAVLALILVFFYPYITLAILALSLVFHFAFLRPRSKDYVRQYLHTCLQLTLERHLTDAVHTQAPTLEAADLRAARLVADNGDKGAILLREGGRGTWKGRSVLLGDATFAHSFPMEGKTHHQFITGCWVTVCLDRDTGLDWRLVERRLMMPAARDQFYRTHPELKLLREGGAVLQGEDWQTFVTQAAPQGPGEPFLRALKKLKGETAGILAVCVAGDRLHVLLTNRILGMKVSVREAPTQAQVDFDRLPELDHILRAAELL